MTRGGGATASLRYDPLGRLYEVTGSGGTRRFLYDGDDLVAEYNSSGTLLRRYVHGLGAGDDPLVWFEGSGVADAARGTVHDAAAQHPWSGLPAIVRHADASRWHRVSGRAGRGLPLLRPLRSAAAIARVRNCKQL